MYDQNSLSNSLNPINDAGHLLNWNDYGYALIPLTSDHNTSANKHKSRSLKKPKDKNSVKWPKTVKSFFKKG